MTEPDPFAEARAAREAIRKEYAAYVALVPIDINGARAFNPGDPVPASHVERKVVAESEVAKSTTKAAAAVTTQG